MSGTLPGRACSSCSASAPSGISAKPSSAVPPTGAENARDAGSSASAPAPAVKRRRHLSIRSSSDLAHEQAVGIESVAEQKRQDDEGSDQDESERARVRGGVPDGERIHHHVREQAVGEAGEGEHENRHGAGEGLPVGSFQAPPHPRPEENSKQRK